MTMIKDLFAKPIDRPIEGVIKADDVNALYEEVDEYVLTGEAAVAISELLDAYNDYSVAQQNGVWISGFFGSGKSHLLKMLALLLENRNIDGNRTLDLFLPKCEGDAELQAQLKKACAIPSKSILFNIDQKSDSYGTRKDNSLLAVFVKVFDEMCGYCGKLGYVAQFERDLASRQLYEPFKKAFEEQTQKNWEKVRKQPILEKRNIAKAYAAVTGEPVESVLGIIDQYRQDFTYSIEDFADQVKAYIDTQPKGFRLNFFVDEVGQYVADNMRLMLDLQEIASALASKCLGNAWLFVTAQEDMTSVFGEQGKQQGYDFSKIQARFANRLKLTSANVDEVIRKRLLSKKKESRAELLDIYSEQEKNFKTMFGFVDGSQTYRQFDDFDDFASCYPFHPYQFSLFQAAIQQLSDHNVFEGRHNSVGERSMLGVFQTVSKRMGTMEVGNLAPFDRMFDGIRLTIKSNPIRSILNAENHLQNLLAIRILKALFLVKYVRPFKATARNVSVLIRSDFNADAREQTKEVQEALNLLENESYIQRSNEFYEFLTDEEQDIEKEIKNTPIETVDVYKKLDRLVFEEILGGTKIRLSNSNHDYALARKIDGNLQGSERDLSMNLVTPWKDRIGGETAFILESSGKAELLIIMPSDDRLMTDVMLLLKTDKYVQQRGSVPNDSIQKILKRKTDQNVDRNTDIKIRAENLLLESHYYINGHQVDSSGESAKTMILSACQELIQICYPHLQMLGTSNYQKKDIESYYNHKHSDLIPEFLSEAEQDILNYLKGEKKKGLRTTIRGLCDHYFKRPYGWSVDTVLCLIAKLAIRGKLTMRKDSLLLEDPAQQAALLNASDYASVSLEPQIAYTSAQIKRTRIFYCDYFQKPSGASDPRQLGRDLLAQMRDFLSQIQGFLKQSDRYPFMTQFSDAKTRLEAAGSKSADYFFTEATSSELDQLIDDREEYFDPLRQFMTGDAKKIYDQAKAALQKEASNLPYVPENESEAIQELLDDPDCYKNQAVPKLKELTQSLQDRIAKAVRREIEEAQNQVWRNQAYFEQMEYSQQITEEQKAGFLARYQAESEKYDDLTIIPQIREERRGIEAVSHAICEDVYLLTHPNQRPAGELVPLPPRPTSFDKPWLENPDDLARYFDVLDAELADFKAKLQKLIREGKRIKL